MLRRAGWKSSDVHSGDEVTAIVAPLLNGDPGGLLLELKVPDGRTLVTGSVLVAEQLPVELRQPPRVGSVEHDRAEPRNRHAAGQPP